MYAWRSSALSTLAIDGSSALLQQAMVDLLTVKTKNPEHLFFGLNRFLTKYMTKEESEDFFSNLLPKIQQLVRDRNFRSVGSSSFFSLLRPP